MINPDEPMTTAAINAAGIFRLSAPNEMERCAMNRAVNMVIPVSRNGIDIRCGWKSPSRKLKNGYSWMVRSSSFPVSPNVLMIRELSHHHQKSSGRHVTIRSTRS